MPYLLMTSSLHVLNWQLVYPSYLFESTQAILDALIYSLKHSLAVVVVADDLFVYANVSHEDLANEFEGFVRETLLQIEAMKCLYPYNFLSFFLFSFQENVYMFYVLTRAFFTEIATTINLKVHVLI